MRSGVLLSLALGLFSAESLASPCKPQSGSSSVVTVSSAASTSVTSSELSLSSTVTETSSAETETETSKSTESSGTTEVASSTESATSETASTTVSSADSTTLSTESTTVVSSTESATSTSATESTTSGSTAQSTTESAESSTSEAASTSSSSVDACPTPNPNPVFKAVDQGSGGNQVILSNGQHGSLLFLSTTSSDYSAMGFTVEPCTNYLRQTNGNYVCISYGTDDYFPPTLITCQLPTISWFEPVTCEQPVAGQPLVCNAPRGKCTPGCHQTGGTPFSQFYSMASQDPFQPATLLYFGNSVEKGVPGSYTAVDFVAQPFAADPPAPTE